MQLLSFQNYVQNQVIKYQNVECHIDYTNAVLLFLIILPQFNN